MKKKKKMEKPTTSVPLPQHQHLNLNTNTSASTPIPQPQYQHLCLNTDTSTSIPTPLPQYQYRYLFGDSPPGLGCPVQCLHLLQDFFQADNVVHQDGCHHSACGSSTTRENYIYFVNPTLKIRVVLPLTCAQMCVYEHCNRSSTAI